ncbi:hypothetical protein [Paraburkholderia tropica]|uniref:hypothetical protein n=1 Tax=Paraburkholderia tropica TaxID=92647 RepID=UPI003D2D7461
MTRRRALAYLIKAQRTLQNELAGHQVREAEQRVSHSDVLGRLIIDVRAARIDRFILLEPLPVEILITD